MEIYTLLLIDHQPLTKVLREEQCEEMEVASVNPWQRDRVNNFLQFKEISREQ